MGGLHPQKRAATDGDGFIVDYFAETLKQLRGLYYAEDYRRYFELDKGLSSQDRTSIEKTTSGLLKILFLSHDASKDEVDEILRFAMEGRKRVYNQLIRIDETFERRRFSYTISDDPSLHTRYIAADSGWKIVLDRGLDISQPFDRRDAFSLQNSVQETRRCRAFEITYLKNSG